MAPAVKFWLNSSFARRQKRPCPKESYLTTTAQAQACPAGARPVGARPADSSADATPPSPRPGPLRRALDRCRKNRPLNVLTIALLPLLATALIQFVSMPFTFDHPLESIQWQPAFWPIVGNLIVIAATLAIFWAVTNRLALAGVLTLVPWLFLAVANCSKMACLDLPLMPGDFTLLGDVVRVFHGEFLVFGGWGKIWLAAGPAAGMVLVLVLLPRVRMGLWRRVLLGVASGAFIATLFSSHTNAFGLLSDYYPKYNWDTKKTYAANGFAVCLAMHCRYLTVQPPDGYGEPAVREIIAALPPATQPAGDLRPNLIVVLSESFRDPTLFPGVEFGDDPVPTFHGLQKEFGSLDVVSPVFAGLTCNAEFEVLTGFNMAFFPRGTGAYVDYIRRPAPSLAWILRDRGYRAISLHAVMGVHSDVQVQPLLGFEQVIGGPQWRNNMWVGGWMSDESSMRETIAYADELAAKGAPYFICVNTIEGHTPYNRDKYGDTADGIRFTKPLSDEAREIMTSYAHGLKNADAGLKLLIDHFRDSKRPTLIVFYGDHLPWMGDNLLVFRETGYCPDGQGGECMEMHAQQAVVWNNYGRRLPEPRGPVGMTQMLPTILDLMDIPKPPHIRLLEKVAKRWPVVSTCGLVDSAGNRATLDQAESDPDLRAYRIMQHDLLFGDKHFKKAP